MGQRLLQHWGDLLREITGWSGADQAERILDAIRSTPTAESQNTLICIALHLPEADSRAHRDIGRKVAALVTDDAILLRSFSDWAHLFEKEKCAEEWRTSCASEPVSAAFTGVSDRTRGEMDAIMRSHLIQIALNAGNRANVRRAIEGVGSFGALSDEERRALSSAGGKPCSCSCRHFYADALLAYMGNAGYRNRYFRSGK